MNEPLRRALLRAQLTDEDVAARLDVDPKTVRRWLAGRTPYLRHRWALVHVLGVDEFELWPHLHHEASMPSEVVAVYPRRDFVRPEAWREFMGSAQREVGILADREFLLNGDFGLAGVLAERAHLGVRVRICISDLALPDGSGGPADPGDEMLASGLREAVRPAEVRTLPGRGYHAICYWDENLAIVQSIHGAPAGHAPVLMLRQADPDDMFATYLAAFEQAWSAAMPWPA